MKVVIDRIEGSVAVLMVADDESVQFNLPVAYLPAGVKEGDHLEVNFTIDPEGRKAAERRVEDLLKDLTKGSDPSQKKFKL